MVDDIYEISKQLGEKLGDTLSVKSAMGTASWNTSNSLALASPNEFREWAESSEANKGLLAVKMDTTAVREYFKQNNEYPPGIKATSIREIRVNKPARTIS